MQSGEVNDSTTPKGDNFERPATGMAETFTDR